MDITTASPFEVDMPIESRPSIKTLQEVQLVELARDTVSVLHQAAEAQGLSPGETMEAMFPQSPIGVTVESNGAQVTVNHRERTTHSRDDDTNASGILAVGLNCCAAKTCETDCPLKQKDNKNGGDNRLSAVSARIQAVRELTEQHGNLHFEGAQDLIKERALEIMHQDEPLSSPPTEASTISQRSSRHQPTIGTDQKPPRSGQEQDMQVQVLAKAFPRTLKLKARQPEEQQTQRTPLETTSPPDSATASAAEPLSPEQIAETVQSKPPSLSESNDIPPAILMQPVQEKIPSPAPQQNQSAEPAPPSPPQTTDTAPPKGVTEAPAKAQPGRQTDAVRPPLPSAEPMIPLAPPPIEQFTELTATEQPDPLPTETQKPEGESRRAGITTNAHPEGPQDTPTRDIIAFKPPEPATGPSAEMVTIFQPDAKHPSVDQEGSQAPAVDRSSEQGTINEADAQQQNIHPVDKTLSDNRDNMPEGTINIHDQKEDITATKGQIDGECGDEETEVMDEPVEEMIADIENSFEIPNEQIHGHATPKDVPAETHRHKPTAIEMNNDEAREQLNAQIDDRPEEGFNPEMIEGTIDLTMSAQRDFDADELPFTKSGVFDEEAVYGIEAPASEYSVIDNQDNDRNASNVSEMRVDAEVFADIQFGAFAQEPLMARGKKATTDGDSTTEELSGKQPDHDQTVEEEGAAAEYDPEEEQREILFEPAVMLVDFSPVDEEHDQDRDHEKPPTAAIVLVKLAGETETAPRAPVFFFNEPGFTELLNKCQDIQLFLTFLRTREQKEILFDVVMNSDEKDHTDNQKELKNNTFRQYDDTVITLWYIMTVLSLLRIAHIYADAHSFPSSI